MIGATQLRWAAVALLLVSCKRGPSGDPQARALVHAYEEFQGASDADREVALNAFAATPCGGASCADRDACVSYGRALLRAKLLVKKAHELGPEDAGGNGAANPTELATIIAGADDATHAAADAEPACSAAVARLYARAR